MDDSSGQDCPSYETPPEFKAEELLDQFSDVDDEPVQNVTKDGKVDLLPPLPRRQYAQVLGPQPDSKLEKVQADSKKLKSADY